MNKKYQKYIEFIANDLQPPYFINMKEMYGLKNDEYEMVLSKVFNQPVSIAGRSDYHNRNVYDKKGKNIYFENTYGGWIKHEYDEQGREIYRVDNYGNWAKYEYNNQGYKIYYEGSNGNWEKYEYDANDNEIYSEDSNGYWIKREYDDNGNLIYRENSDGDISDRR
jgi:hypothetical protein